MIPQFAGLNDTEQKLLINAIPLITALIAGADGNIDSEEKEWAAKIMKIRGYQHPPALEGYYKLVGDKFATHLDELINTLPTGTDDRIKMISEELAQLNDIFPKMDHLQAAHFYHSFVTFAEHVAKASGGILGFGAISRAEGKYVGLPMINKIEMPEDAEETPYEDEETED